jgi:DNA-binding transcriptional MocR family regulator
LPTEPTRQTIVIGPAAHELRRYVGATSWMVLEEMMQAATGPADRLVAEVSIRSLAASLGLAKDTVTRAVRRLRDVGVIEVEQRRSERGVFEAGVYRIIVPAPCLAVVASTTQRSRTSPTKPRRRNPSTTPSSDPSQLALSFPS